MEMRRQSVLGGSAERALRVLEAVVVEAGGKVRTATPDHLEATFGSRLTYRMFGALMRPGVEQLPIRMVVTFEAVDQTSTTVHVAAFDNPGFYFFTTDISRRTYSEKIPALLDELERRLDAKESRP